MEVSHSKRIQAPQWALLTNSFLCCISSNKNCCKDFPHISDSWSTGVDCTQSCAQHWKALRAAESKTRQKWLSNIGFCLGHEKNLNDLQADLEILFSVLLQPWVSNEGGYKQDHRHGPSCMARTLLNGPEKQPQIQHCSYSFELNNLPLIPYSLLQPLAFRKRSHQNNWTHFTASFLLGVTCRGSWCRSEIMEHFWTLTKSRN